MKRLPLIVMLVFSLLFVTVLLTHYFPEKVPKGIATSLPETYYKKLPRQVRDFFPWIKPKGYVKPFTFTKEDIAALNLPDDPTNIKDTNNKNTPQSTTDYFQQVLEEFYQNMKQDEGLKSYELLHSISKENLNVSNFANYYILTSETFEVNKITVNKKFKTIPEYKDPHTGKIIAPLLEAQVKFDYSDNISASHAKLETVTRSIFFAQESGIWKIVELDINNNNFIQKRFYYFIEEGYRRIGYKDPVGAIELFRKAIKTNKYSLNANYGLSAALYSISYYDKAITTVQKMQIYYNKKYITNEVVDKIDLKTVKSLDKERLSNGYYIMALSFLKLKNQPAAKDALNRALALKADNKFAIDTLKKIPRSVIAKAYPFTHVASDDEDPFAKLRVGTTEPKPKEEVFNAKEALGRLQSR